MGPGGDAPEFEAEFDRLFGRAFSVARRLTGDAATAEDVAAETLIRTYVHWGRVRRFEHPDAWVARVATNLAIKSMRRGGSLPARVAADPSDEAALRLALVDALATCRAANARRSRCAISPTSASTKSRAHSA